MDFMNFMNAMKSELDNRKTLTTNGAVAYETSGKELLDFLFAVTALRSADESNIKSKFANVYFEEPLTAVQFLFWLRDCRGGNGERRIFRICLDWLAENKPSVAKAVIDLVPEYARWDDLWGLLDTELKDDIVKSVSNKLEEDVNATHPSLLAKWLPSENTSSHNTRRFAEIIRSGLGMTPKQYRQTLSKLRKRIDVVERKMSAKEWNSIDYQTVPSQANIKYNNAFLRNDEVRRREFLNALSHGEAKINASTLQPHEIVNKYVSISGFWNTGRVREYDETLEQLWKALPNITIGNSLVVRDGSGSMTSGYGTKVRPLDVATALSIYMADHNTGIWKDKFITFSASPKIINLSNCTTLRDKLIETYNHDECSNTNIEATMMLILQTAINNHCSQSEMPQKIIICSDMQFDNCVVCNSTSRSGWWDSGVDKTLFENIAEEFNRHGYMMPKIIFWNLAGQVNNTIPMQKNELGVVLMSGFSVHLLNMIMSGKTDPYEVILETLNSERYALVKNAVKHLV